MAIVSVRNLSMGYLGPPLLDQISFDVDPGDRIGLLGRNGTGKSTLLKILAGSTTPDEGEVVIAPGIRVGFLDQEVPSGIDDTVINVVSQGFISAPGTETTEWQAQTDANQILSRMELNGSTRFGTLSSGMKRRVLLARALISKPDLLLLDEPTNHLDVDSIVWLETFLQRSVPTFVFVTHDRVFLRNLSNRILEIDRGHLFDWKCDYETFLVRKEQALATEEKENALFDKRLAEEEKWLRTGIKARRTRNEGRVRALKAMRQERSQRRERLGTSKLQIQEGQKSGNLVIALDDVSFDYGGNTIIDSFSTAIMRGDKVGIIGPNGAGKSTLLKLMLGQLEAKSGNIRLGTHLQIAFFDQLREQLNPEATVQENVSEGNDTIKLNGGTKHILGYLQDFLFTPERARTQVKFLSGGERNRILLAKLFTKPANIIVLDEPTNDLDAETLELLEEKIIEFSGTVLIVSHDRAFLNQVVSSVIAFEPNGIFEYVGGYDDWQRQLQQKSESLKTLNPASQKRSSQTSKTSSTSHSDENKNNAPRKLKYKERLELEQLPSRIEQLEAEISQINQIICDPSFYQKPKSEIVAAQEQLKQLENNLDATYARWEELDQIENE